MRAAFSDRVERARMPDAGPAPSRLGDPYGMFDLITDSHPRTRLLVMVSAGIDEMPWEHVSVSTKKRCPTWPELAWVKSLFWDDEEAVMQLHPPKSMYVNYHPYCLHLWKPRDIAIPLPPTIAVGPLGVRMPGS